MTDAATPSAITGTWSDLEGYARYAYETKATDSGEYELAEAVLVLLGLLDRQQPVLAEIGVEVRLADDLAPEQQLAGLWTVVRHHSKIAREALNGDV